MMSAIIRQLYCHIVQGRQPVTRIFSTNFSQRRRQCHDNVVVSNENKGKKREPADEKKNKPFQRKTSFDRLRGSNKGNESFNRIETEDTFHLNREKRIARVRKSNDGLNFNIESEKRPPKGTESGDDFEFNNKNRTIRLEKTDELNKEDSVVDGNEFNKGKQAMSSTLNKAEEGNKKNNWKGNTPVLGSGNRFGIKYSNKKYPVKGEVLFGYHPVSIALSQGRRHCHKLFIQRGRTLSPEVDILGIAKEAKIPVEQVSRVHLDQLCLGRPHQGICMDAAPINIQNLSPEDIRSAVVEPPPIWVLPYEIVDPMNMGAILRSSYYFGVDTVVLPVKHGATASPMVSKASSGAMEVMQLFYLKNKTATMQFLEDWKANVGQIIGTATGPDTVPVTDCVVTMPTLLIVGNEHHGLRKDILEQCDSVVKLQERSPGRQPIIGSLNVSVATGIVLHALKTNRPYE